MSNSVEQNNEFGIKSCGNEDERNCNTLREFIILKNDIEEIEDVNIKSDEACIDTKNKNNNNASMKGVAPAVEPASTPDQLDNNEGLISKPARNPNLTKPKLKYGNTKDKNGQPSESVVESANPNLHSNRTVRILIDRDYADVFKIRFATNYPSTHPELCTRIDQEKFDFTMHQINGMFQQAEKCSCSTCFQSCSAYLTGGFVYSCWESKYEKCMRLVSKFIHEQNQRVYIPRGLLLKDPVEKALRNLEIIIIDNDSNSENAEGSEDSRIQSIIAQ